MILPVFITGNQNKADYLTRLLGLSLNHQKIELDEIQSVSLDEIVTHKVKQAYQMAGKPVLVEDVAMGFDALDGLPGPFVKFFVESDSGLENMCRMLDGFNNRSARAFCTFGYYDGTTLQLIRGEIRGVIADHPRGEGGFGWDRIFCPEGYDGRTRAELTPEEYDVVYRVVKPVTQLKEFLTK